MREGRCVSLIERLKQGSELKSTLSIGRLFQRFMTRSVNKVGSNRAIVPKTCTYSREQNCAV